MGQEVELKLEVPPSALSEAGLASEKWRVPGEQ
jgi:hypothetical protein